MTENTPATPLSLLREYADCLRGDWGSIDGRSEKVTINRFADLIFAAGPAYELPLDVAMFIRGEGNMCPAGRGHWIRYCDVDCPDLKEGWAPERYRAAFDAARALLAGKGETA